jgi:hypothetical protein
MLRCVVEKSGRIFLYYLRVGIVQFDERRRDPDVPGHGDGQLRARVAHGLRALDAGVVPGVSRAGRLPVGAAAQLDEHALDQLLGPNGARLLRPARRALPLPGAHAERHQGAAEIPLRHYHPRRHPFHHTRSGGQIDHTSNIRPLSITLLIPIIGAQ